MRLSRNVVRMFTFKFGKLQKYRNGKRLKILDVGAANQSAEKTKSVFPECEYHAIDQKFDAAYDNKSIKQIDHFFEMDLTKLDFEAIPDYYYDMIICSHVIEHLYNGDQVIRKLIKKMAPGGVLYLEWPSINSTSLPRKKGTLNFFQDDTHVRIYSLREIYNLLLAEGLKFVDGGHRRSKMLILMIPFKAIYSKVRHGYVNASTFWDLMGFAEYCIFRKE